MQSTTTIRDHLESYLKREQMSISFFSDTSGINSGTLSNILNKNRPIAMQQLDRITAAMRLGEGHFYELYIDECFVHATPDWRRLGPFLHRCADLGKLNCIEEVIRLMMDNLSYIPLLFEVAEEFYRDGKFEPAILLYETIAESEKMQHSERLALCQYRLFKLGLSKDQQRNLIIAAQFEYYVDRLDERYQLDALNELINAFGALHRWNKVQELSEKLRVKATIHYELNGRKKPEETKRPIIFYILYSYLAAGSACYHLKDYDQALEYVSLYAVNNWVKECNDEEALVITQFQEWAEANRYIYRLMAGQFEVLPDYLNYISTRENEIFPALCDIVKAANRYNGNIDFVLEQYESYFTYQEQSNRIGKVSKQVTDDRYVRLLADLGAYYLKRDEFQKGLDFVINSLKFSLEICSGRAMLRGVGLFEQYRDFATDTAKQQYKIIISEVQKLNEENVGFADSHM
ncbi:MULTISPECIES: transcriptional regulator [unclassified Paenibacillus]|uniref:transcriptional regulator n=1 Tax=unclassified Paenibacillus TaxID=185978 RepID=UPI00157F7F6F|nr:MULTISPECIES: transcriptional regulator [unclassified Paenibacillus]MCM3173691.1 transcriptional regulator [Paenibacillus sp. MER 99-2]